MYSVLMSLITILINTIFNNLSEDFVSMTIDFDVLLLE